MLRRRELQSLCLNENFQSISLSTTTFDKDKHAIIDDDRTLHLLQSVSKTRFSGIPNPSRIRGKIFAPHGATCLERSMAKTNNKEGEHKERHRDGHEPGGEVSIPETVECILKESD